MRYLPSGLAQARPVALDTRLLSRTVLKEGTAHPQLCTNAGVNGFWQVGEG